MKTTGILILLAFVAAITFGVWLYFFDRTATCVTVGVEGVPCRRENLTWAEFNRKYPDGPKRE